MATIKGSRKGCLARVDSKRVLDRVAVVGIEDLSPDARMRFRGNDNGRWEVGMSEVGADFSVTVAVTKRFSLILLHRRCKI